MAVSPFSHSPPSTPSSSDPLDDTSDPILTSPSFHSSLLTPTSPELISLRSLLLSRRVQKQVDEEVKVLGGELRDEWRGRVGAVKADWMARIVPTSFQDLNESTEVEGEGGGTEGEGEGMKPTIISDVDEREAMVSRVDSGVEVEFEERLKEATERIRSGVERSEELEVDLYLGSLLLEARDETDDEDLIERVIKAGLLDALELTGYDVESWVWPIPTNGLSDVVTGVEGIQLS